jgi:hypothetical protein
LDSYFGHIDPVGTGFFSRWVWLRRADQFIIDCSADTFDLMVIKDFVIINIVYPEIGRKTILVLLHKKEFHMIQQ